MKKLIYIPIVLFLLFSCKKEQPALQELDCDCAKEVSADFLMEEMTTGNENFARYTNTDSIGRNKNVRFTAIENDAEYTWYLGSEIIYEQSFTRFFDSSLSGQEIPVTLVVKKKSNTICFPNDGGYDSIIKKIIVVNLYPIFDYDNLDIDLGLLEGTFRVKTDLIADSFDITIDGKVNGLSQEFVNFYNYDGIGSDCILNAEPSGFNYRQLFITGGDMLCDNLWGDIYYRLDNIVEFTFNFGTTFNNDKRQVKYFGRKL